MSPAALEAALDHEHVGVRPGRRTGLPVIIAVNSTRLGPAVGGVRITRYSSPSSKPAPAVAEEAIPKGEAAKGIRRPTAPR